MRGRIAYKLLTLLLVGGVILIFHFTFNVRHEDEFLTQLPVKNDKDDVVRKLPTAQHKLHLNGSPNQKLLNLTNFQYILPNDICNQYDKEELLAIIVVTSYAGNDALRAAHRQAISQSKLAEMGFQRIFLLGDLPPTEHFIKQAQLLNEQQLFGDLLQGNFKEAYRNLSYKHIMGLRWAATDCKRAKFVIKLDDDTVYDVFQVRRYLDSLELQQTALASSSALLAGYILDAKAPIREPANKWFVSLMEYTNATYPDYLSGMLYISNVPTVKRLVHEANLAPFFWIDDTWVTGVLRERLDIPLQRLNPWYTINSGFIDCCVHDLKQSNYECEYFVGPNGGDSKLVIEFLHNVEKCYFDECLKRPPEKSLKQTCVVGVKHVVPPHGNSIIKQIKLR